MEHLYPRILTCKKKNRSLHVLIVVNSTQLQFPIFWYHISFKITRTVGLIDLLLALGHSFSFLCTLQQIEKGILAPRLVRMSHIHILQYAPVLASVIEEQGAHVIFYDSLSLSNFSTLVGKVLLNASVSTYTHDLSHYFHFERHHLTPLDKRMRHENRGNWKDYRIF